PAPVDSVSVERVGGAQRCLVGLAGNEASAKKFFQKQSPWEILLTAAKDTTPRYEKYSRAERADVFRVHLSFEVAASLMKQIQDASPRSLRKRLSTIQPPAAILFFIPRANSAREQAPP